MKYIKSVKDKLNVNLCISEYFPDAPHILVKAGKDVVKYAGIQAFCCLFL